MGNSNLGDMRWIKENWEVSRYLESANRIYTLWILFILFEEGKVTYIQPTRSKI